MNRNPEEILLTGYAILDGVLLKRSFKSEKPVSGKSSGGDYASGGYRNGDRRLELYFRFSLGLVTYHFGALSLGHEDYLRAILGPARGNKYPSFSDEPLDAFRGLASDLETYATAFLDGDEAEFARLIETARKNAKIVGFARLP